MRVAGLTVVIAAAALLTFSAPARAAAWREAPWCAVIDYGDGDVSWDCNYRSFEACYPNVLAGNRGFCNVNPAGPGAATAAPRTLRPHHRRHARR
jgi:hypothetical protein